MRISACTPRPEQGGQVEGAQGPLRGGGLADAEVEPERGRLEGHGLEGEAAQVDPVELPAQVLDGDLLPAGAHLLEGGEALEGAVDVDRLLGPEGRGVVVVGAGADAGGGRAELDAPR